MPLRFSLTLPLLVLILLALLSFWIEHYVQAPEKVTGNKSRLHNADYFMDNFVTSKTDDRGRLKSKLAAIRLEHYPDDDSIHVIRPRFTQYASNGSYNQIEAQRGLISADGETAEFFDHVTVLRPAHKNRQSMSLQTDYLKIIPDQNLATTPSAVRINLGENSYMMGTGMIYDKESGNLTLQKKVKIRYVKSSPAKAPSSNVGKVSGKNTDNALPTQTSKTETGKAKTDKAKTGKTELAKKDKSRSKKVPAEKKSTQQTPSPK